MPRTPPVSPLNRDPLRTTHSLPAEQQHADLSLLARRVLNQTPPPATLETSYPQTPQTTAGQRLPCPPTAPHNGTASPDYTPATPPVTPLRPPQRHFPAARTPSPDVMTDGRPPDYGLNDYHAP